jgi:excisionase family DNA binding protein
MRGTEVETYLTIEEAAAYLKLAAQTIRRYVLNREIPFHKIRKVIRFRLSDIEAWIDYGGICGEPAVTGSTPGAECGELFAGVDSGETDTGAGTETTEGQG